MTIEESVGFGACDFVVEAREAVTVSIDNDTVIFDVCVVVGKVKVRWDVTCGLGSEMEEG